ncbi:uncharacterized protein EDB91DRAFT_1176340 [Suillus paluster]|uniref:uncharacterized protein n=1 Tax=Suillus paluster TaxID=48578 RepID=UPI001B86D2BD|nr:uncharacterized protein EDB91DRAFT_1176340 [Suillus paluster]KAG1721391.1 hypothetical protein EDB91DRAFT_1176340 [Suillus paluster]
MVKKYQKSKASHARIARWTANTHISLPSRAPSVADAAENDDEFMDSQSDCGYTGGVNVEVLSSDSESEYEPNTSESEWSDGESLCELEGDGLEENLAALKAEVDALQQPAGFKFEKIMEEKTATEWKKAEQIRALGYNRHSDRTKRRYNKIARDLADYREKRRTS